jgi:hypothetical protein
VRVSKKSRLASIIERIITAIARTEITIAAIIFVVVSLNGFSLRFVICFIPFFILLYHDMRIFAMSYFL